MENAMKLRFMGSLAMTAAALAPMGASAGAVARVKVTLPGDWRYRDDFTLIRSNGVWKIGLKAFANP
jgi:hypothetical protein